MSYTVSRILLGLIFVVFGLNGFVTFIPVPEFHPFMEILVDSGYIYVIKAIEVAAGALLLSSRRVPLAAALLTPIVMNICLYHALLDPRNGLIAPLLVLLLSVVFYHHRARFQALIGD